MLQSQGFGARKQCRELVEQGLVTVEGNAVTDPSAMVHLREGLPFTFDDEDWEYREKAYVLFHKPTGYECSNKPTNNPSIHTILPTQLGNRGVQSVGRLDVESSGMLILTDDGPMLHAITSPKREKPKVYETTLKHPITDSLVEQLRRGVVLHDVPEGLVYAKEVEKVSDHVLLITITEGRYHQVPLHV